MVTGYEVEFYANVQNIRRDCKRMADALEKIADALAPTPTEEENDG